MPASFLAPLFAASLLVLCAVTAHAQPAPFADASPELKTVVDRAVRSAVEAFAAQKLTADQLAVTLVDLRDPHRPRFASHRGDRQVYPASVIKLFYLAAAQQWLEDGRLADAPELRRAMSDMIVHSYNEATHYVVDLLTGTTSGPELSEGEIQAWFDRRNAVNRHFTSLGYANINANKKPWCEGPYGRETQAIKLFEPKRNMLTTDATARLLTDIVTGKSVSAKRSAEMMELLKRDPLKQVAPGGEPDQNVDFTAPALPKGVKLWSKAGWTSQTRHDAAYVELPNGTKFVLITFTEAHANERGIIPTVAKTVVERLTASAANQ
jgi:beta-lactamase class A